MLTWISWPNSSWVNYTLLECSPLLQMWHYLMLFFAFPLKIPLESCCCCVAHQKCMCNNFRWSTHKSTHKYILYEHRSSNVWIWLVLLLLLMLLLFLLFSDTIYYYWFFSCQVRKYRFGLELKSKPALNAAMWHSNFGIQFRFISRQDHQWQIPIEITEWTSQNLWAGIAARAVNKACFQSRLDQEQIKTKKGKEK